MKKIILLLFTTLLLASCLSVPTPQNDKEAMAVLYTEFEKETNKETFGSYLFTISNSEAGYEKKIRITMDKVYFLNGLEAGQYDVTYKFVYDSGKMGTNNELFSFSVTEGRAQIIKYKIVSKIYEKEKGQVYMTREKVRLNDFEDLKEKLVAQYPELESWYWGY